MTELERELGEAIRRIQNTLRRHGRGQCVGIILDVEAATVLKHVSTPLATEPVRGSGDRNPRYAVRIHDVPMLCARPEDFEA